MDEVSGVHLIPSQMGMVPSAMSQQQEESPCCPWLMHQHRPVARKKSAARSALTKMRSCGSHVLAAAPYLMLSISLIELAVLVVGLASPTFSAKLHSVLVFDPGRRDEAWRFLSYMLVHAGAAHAALNLSIQILLAVPLEQEQGAKRTALVYLGGGLAGSLSTSVLEPELYLVGASGGVYALLTSQLANIVLNFPGLRYRIPRAVAVCLISLADVIFSLYHHFHLGNRCPRVGWAAHTGGALAGLLLGLLIFRPPPPGVALPLFVAAPGLALEGPAHKPRREFMLTAARCVAAAVLSGALAAAITLNLLRRKAS